MGVKDIIAIGGLCSILLIIFAWKCKLSSRKVKCNSCGHTVPLDEWEHFKHCPNCKCEDCTKLWKEKK